jgi:hypothetical protein
MSDKGTRGMSLIVNFRQYGTALAVLILLAAVPAQAVITVEFISPDRWGESDVDLGLDGGVVENFEDTALAQGLLLEISDASGNFTGTGSNALPNIFDPVNGDPFGNSFVTGVWDGSSVLVNTVDNQSQYYGSSDWRPFMFTVPAGTAWFALAAQQVSISHGLIVNGVSLGRLGALGFPVGPERNGMMIIRSDDPLQPIISVSFGGRGDAFVLDHVVFAPPGAVPVEAGTWGGLKALYR